jgi:gluconokinase
VDPEQLRNAALKALVDVAGPVPGTGDRVIAISLSAFLHAVVPMDAAGRPLGPLVTWADGRAGALAPQAATGYRDGGQRAIAALRPGRTNITRARRVFPG